MNAVTNKNKNAKALKRSKKVLTLNEKGEILDLLDKKEPVASIARKYKINESSVRTIRQNKDKIRHSLQSSAPKCAKVAGYTRSGPIEKMEKALSLWIEDQNQKRAPLSSALIRDKATRLYENFVDDEPLSSNTYSKTFLPSKGWFERFKCRHSLHNLKVQGEAASADINAAREYPKQLLKIIEEGGFQPEQVFNADETGLFWKKMPNRTFLSKEEKTAQGFKVAKDRLTLLLCTNASGDCMIKPLLVYKSMNPRALKNIYKNKLPVFWRANSHAWVTGDIFLDWFENCFIPEVRRYLTLQNLAFKVLLVIDNAPGHPAVRLQEINPNVRVEFLPPNTTSLLQPLDQGIIAIYKAYYTRRTFKMLLENLEHDPTKTLSQYWKDYTIADCLGNIKESLDELKQSTLNGCWKNLWPEIVKSHAQVPDIRDEIKEIADLGKSLPGEGFDDMREDDIKQLFESHNVELTERELIELTENNYEAPDIDEDNEVVLAPQELTLKTLNKCFSMAHDLTELLIREDPTTERSLKTKREIFAALAPYKEVEKNLRNEAKQSKITSYFSKN